MLLLLLLCRKNILFIQEFFSWMQYNARQRYDVADLRYQNKKQEKGSANLISTKFMDCCSWREFLHVLFFDASQAISGEVFAIDIISKILSSQCFIPEYDEIDLIRSKNEYNSDENFLRFCTLANSMWRVVIIFRKVDNQFCKCRRTWVVKWYSFHSHPPLRTTMGILKHGFPEVTVGIVFTFCWI